jgi:hypothetical protein
VTEAHCPSLKIRRHVKHLGQAHFQAGGTDLQQMPTARINFSFRLIPTMFSCYVNITLRNTEHILCTPCISNSPYNISPDFDVKYTRSTIQILKKKTCCQEPTPPVISTGGYELATCTFSLLGVLCKACSLDMWACDTISKEWGEVEQEEVKRDISLKH